MPPLKKYVTCAYFSVSATWNWRQPGLAERLGQRPRRLGREGDEDRQSLLVRGHRHDEEVSGRRTSRGRSPVEALEVRPVGERVRQLASAVGAEVQVDDRVGVLDRADRRLRRPLDDRRDDELVGLTARVGRLDRVDAPTRAVCIASAWTIAS